MFKRVIQSSPYSQPGPVCNSGCVCSSKGLLYAVSAHFMFASEGILEATEYNPLYLKITNPFSR